MGSAQYRPVIWMSLNVPTEQERSRAFHSLAVIARLKAGASIQQAQAEMDTIAARAGKCLSGRGWRLGSQGHQTQ